MRGELILGFSGADFEGVIRTTRSVRIHIDMRHVLHRMYLSCEEKERNVVAGCLRRIGCSYL